MIRVNSMDRLVLTAINNHNEQIKGSCALSITHQEIEFWYRGKLHNVKYRQTKKGNYFIINNVRYYFKVYDNAYNKWLIDCNCF